MTDLDCALTEIARQHMGIDTLETRRRDSLDFHDVAVWALADALRAAYDLGRAHGDVCAAGAVPRRDGPKKSRPAPQ